METLISYFILSLIPIVLILSIFYLNSKEKRKKRDLKLRILKLAIQCVIIVIFVFLFLFFIINLEIFTAEPSSSIIEIVFMVCSQLILVFSSILFLYTFKSPKIFELIMEYPSKSESKIGNINIGRVIDKHKVRHKFYLNVEDLAQHMFVCGTTGTGKSNFLQHFLLDFTKKYDIPNIIKMS